MPPFHLFRVITFFLRKFGLFDYPQCLLILAEGEYKPRFCSEVLPRQLFESSGTWGFFGILGCADFCDCRTCNK